MCLCVCVCVCMGDKEGERPRERVRERDTKQESERERERYTFAQTARGQRSSVVLLTCGLEPDIYKRFVTETDRPHLNRHLPSLEWERPQWGPSTSEPRSHGATDRPLASAVSANVHRDG